MHRKKKAYGTENTVYNCIKHYTSKLLLQPELGVVPRPFAVNIVVTYRHILIITKVFLTMSVTFCKILF